jgi:membrane fusion protein (multidrug efflux system)
MHAPHQKSRSDSTKPPAASTAPSSRMIGIAVVALVLVGGVVWWAMSGTTGAATTGKGKGPVGVPIETVVAKPMKTTSDIPAVGSLRSDEHVQIAPEIAGRIAEIRFQEGEPVKQGEVLVLLDDALTRAEVAEAEARLYLAKANFERAETLTKSRNIAERAYDEARANFETARAAHELAQVRLSKHTIRAPFNGIVGFRALSAGAFISIGATLVNLEKIDVLKLDFKIPEIFLSDVRVGQKVDVTVDALPKRTFQAEIYAIDPLVDVNGRALQIRARLSNPELVLRPGLFARISIRGRTEREVVMVPESAIVPRAGEFLIFRVEDGKAVESKVGLGNRRSGMVEVTSGLMDGATVVTAGHQRLKNGAAVDIVNAGAKSQQGKGG